MILTQLIKYATMELEALAVWLIEFFSDFIFLFVILIPGAGLSQLTNRFFASSF